MPAYGSIPKVSAEGATDIKSVHLRNGQDDTKETSPLIADGDDAGLNAASRLHPLLAYLQHLWSQIVRLAEHLISKCIAEERMTQLSISCKDFKERLQGSSFLQILTAVWTNLIFNWFTPVLHRGNEKKKLDPEDMDLVPFPPNCETESISNTFYQNWNEESRKAQEQNNKKTGKTTMEEPSLVKALWNSFGTEFCKAGLLKLIHDCCIFVGPQVLNAMIYYLRDAHAPVSRGLGLTTLVTISQLAMSFCLRHYFFSCYLVGLKIRTAIVMAVYQKALVLAAGERQTRTVGEITNLMSIDAKRLQGKQLVTGRKKDQDICGRSLTFHVPTRCRPQKT